jgi:hypothetical protein
MPSRCQQETQNQHAEDRPNAASPARNDGQERGYQDPFALCLGRLLCPRPGTITPSADHITWHTRDVFKGKPLAA